MARPPKSGLDYFSHDTDTERDLEFIEAKHGLTGYAVYFKLLERVYDDAGYYLQWSERLCIVLAKKWGISGEELQAIVDDLLAEGIFSKPKYDEHSILTSPAIQRRFIFGCEKRTKISMREDYLVAPVELSRGARVEVQIVDVAGNCRLVVQKAGSVNQNAGNGSQESLKHSDSDRDSTAAAREPGFREWLKTWAATSPTIRAPDAFVRKVMARPDDYPDLVALWRDRDRAPPTTPDPPGRCPTCSGTSIEVEAGLAECADCAQSWGLVKGRWVVMPHSSRIAPATVAGVTR